MIKSAIQNKYIQLPQIMIMLYQTARREVKVIPNNRHTLIYIVIIDNLELEFANELVLYFFLPFKIVALSNVNS